MINIHVDEKNSSFYFLDKNKYNIISSRENFIFDSKIEDDNIYIKTRRCSWMSGKDNIIDMTREHDLDMLAKIKNFGFNFPHFLYCNNNIQYYRHMENDVEYILKSFNSARSIGQMFVNKENIQEIISNSSLSVKDFNKKYDIDLSTCDDEDSKSKLRDSIRSHDFYLSEKQSFDVEYRILYIEDTPNENFIIEEREGYQIHSKEKRSHKVITPLFTDIRKKVKAFGDTHYAPMLSFDVWVDDDTWGLFEYSTEFGTIYTNHNKILEQQINNIIEKRIGEIK